MLLTKTWRTHLLIFVLVIVHQLISAIWYSPYLFGFKWIVLAKFSLASIPPPDSFAFYLPFIVSIIASIFLCYGLLALISALKITKIKKALLLATICWLAFSFGFVFTHNSFANRPFSLTIIDAIRDWILFIVTAVTFAIYTARGAQHE